MKKFLIRTALFLVMLLLGAFVLFSFADGNVDPFYLRFTSPKQSSLIVGTSRAAQGIDPAVINESLGAQLDGPLFNYAFTLAHSPYGKAYLESIKAKLDPSVTEGIFIVCVDPWSISVNAESLAAFPEEKTFMGKLHYVSMEPNAEYLMRFYPRPLYTLLTDRDNKKQVLHDNGWLEINVSMDSISAQRRLQSKLAEYQGKRLISRFSPSRFDYLEKTVEFLKEHGRVYLLRLPVHPELFAIDDQLIPDFRQRIEMLAQRTGSNFIDLSPYNNDYSYTDGNHLHKESARKVSLFVADQIRHTLPPKTTAK